MKTERQKLAIIILVVSFPIALTFLYFSSTIDRLRNEKDTYVMEKITNKENQIAGLKAKIEEQTRKQMRLILRNAEKGMEMFIDEYKPNMLDTKERRKVLQIFTNFIQYYDSEGNSFAVNSLGEFDLDDDVDCGQPMSLINPNIPLINLPKRKRYFYDEMAWKKEAELILYLHGLIEHIEPETLKYYTGEIKIIKKFQLDKYLNDSTIYATKEIEYIEKKYPEIFYLLKKYKVVMHSEYKLVEPVLNFLNTHRDSNETTDLYWYFNPRPYKELLEVVWLPDDKYGYNGEVRSLSGGAVNPNHLRNGLVLGTQWEKIISEYNFHFEQIEKNTNIDIVKAERDFKFIRFLLITTCFAVIVFFTFSVLSLGMLLEAKTKK